MDKCKHHYVTYLGEQETLRKAKSLKLYHCISCQSTITLNKNNNSKIIGNMDNNLKNPVYHIAFGL